MLTDRILENYRISVLRDGDAAFVLSVIYKDGAKDEAGVASSTGMSLPQCKRVVDRLFRAGMLKTDNIAEQSGWTTTPLAESILIKMGVHSAIASHHVDEAALSSDDGTFLKARLTSSEEMESRSSMVIRALHVDLTQGRPRDERRRLLYAVLACIDSRDGGNSREEAAATSPAVLVHLSEGIADYEASTRWLCKEAKAPDSYSALSLTFSRLLAASLWNSGDIGLRSACLRWTEQDATGFWEACTRLPAFDTAARSALRAVTVGFRASSGSAASPVKDLAEMLERFRQSVRDTNESGVHEPIGSRPATTLPNRPGPSPDLVVNVTSVNSRFVKKMVRRLIGQGIKAVPMLPEIAASSASVGLLLAHLRKEDELAEPWHPAILRRQELPTIVCCDRPSTQTTRRLLLAGADDVVSTSLPAEELSARIVALQRRYRDRAA